MELPAVAARPGAESLPVGTPMRLTGIHDVASRIPPERSGGVADRGVGQRVPA